MCRFPADSCRFIEVAGGLITPDSQDAAPADKKFVGSVLLYEADSIEDVRKLIEQDLYWTEDVVSWFTIPSSRTLCVVTVGQGETYDSPNGDGHNAPRQGGNHAAKPRRLTTAYCGFWTLFRLSLTYTCCGSNDAEGIYVIDPSKWGLLILQPELCDYLGMDVNQTGGRCWKV